MYSKMLLLSHEVKAEKNRCIRKMQLMRETSVQIPTYLFHSDLNLPIHLLPLEILRPAKMRKKATKSGCTPLHFLLCPKAFPLSHSPPSPSPLSSTADFSHCLKLVCSRGKSGEGDWRLSFCLLRERIF